MKLFKQLLVAPAALGLLAPIAANADVSTLSNVENQLADVQAGMFSSTTVMSGSVNFVTGLTNDHATLGDELHSTYELKYGLNLVSLVKTRLPLNLNRVTEKEWASMLKAIRVQLLVLQS